MKKKHGEGYLSFNGKAVFSLILNDWYYWRFITPDGNVSNVLFTWDPEKKKIVMKTVKKS